MDTSFVFYIIEPTEEEMDHLIKPHGGRFKLLHELSQSDTEGFLPVFERVVTHEMENIAKLDKSIVYY